MQRVIAQVQGRNEAFAAIQALVANSFAVDDLALRALPKDADPVEVPIHVQSHLFHGMAIGALLAVPIGAAIGWTTASPDMAAPFGALSAGAGAAVGAAIGLGSWAVVISKGRIPADTEAFVVVVTVPDGRAEHARRILHRMGGVDAAPADTSG